MASNSYSLNRDRLGTLDLWQIVQNCQTAGARDSVVIDECWNQ